MEIIPNYSQQDATFISKDALHVSGGSYSHHQEQTHTTVQRVSGILNQYCC
jgi:hypothetical protein